MAREMLARGIRGIPKLRRVFGNKPVPKELMEIIKEQNNTNGLKLKATRKGNDVIVTLAGNSNIHFYPNSVRSIKNRQTGTTHFTVGIMDCRTVATSKENVLQLHDVHDKDNLDAHKRILEAVSEINKIHE